MMKLSSLLGDFGKFINLLLINRYFFRYAYRAKSIKNKPIKNEDIKDAKLLALQQEIERLKQLIMEKSNGEVINNELDEDDQCGDSEDDSKKEEKEKQLEVGKMEVDELSRKLKTLEKQMVHGGKNIVDSVNENEVRLEQQRAEIAARKVDLYINFLFHFPLILLLCRNGKSKCNKRSN